MNINGARKIDPDLLHRPNISLNGKISTEGYPMAESRYLVFEAVKKPASFELLLESYLNTVCHSQKEPAERQFKYSILCLLTNLGCACLTDILV